jgi:cytochrome c oxidase assembly protein subunit 15
MAGRFGPDAMWALDPFWRNLFENEATAQFLHRMMAYILFFDSLFIAWKFRRTHWSLFLMFAGLVTAQAVLGIATLMRAAPLDMSLTHQALGTVVLLAATRLVWTARKQA